MAGESFKGAMRREPVCHVVCAGPGQQTRIDVQAGDFVIAADGGFRTCKEAGIVPDLLIGDFDSLAQGDCPADCCPCVRLPVEKDDTDTVAALREGLRRGFTCFELHAALGGDVGHELANLQALLFLRAHGAHGTLHGQGQRVVTVAPQDGEVMLQTVPGMRVSMFAFGGDAHGVCERGLKWELEDADLAQSFPLGVSNEALGTRIRLRVGAGLLLVVLG